MTNVTTVPKYLAIIILEVIKMILKMDNVIKRFNDHLALDYLSLEANKGEVIGLLGPNGAGKQHV